jgi:hypothetical protein
VGDTGERHQVVLAHRPELDVADHDHLVVADVEGRGQHVLGRHPHPAGDLGVHPRDPGGGVEQPVALGVLADRREQLSHGRFRARLVERRYVLRRPVGRVDGVGHGGVSRPGTAASGRGREVPRAGCRGRRHRRRAG